MNKRIHLAPRQDTNNDQYNHPDTKQYNYFPNLKGEIHSILDGADLRNYAVDIVKLILTDKHRKIENHHAEIEYIVNNWLRNKNYKISLEHRHLDDILSHQTKMKEQLDKLTYNCDRLPSIQYTVSCSNIKINRLLEKDQKQCHTKNQGNTTHAHQANQTENTSSRRSERKRAVAVKEAKGVSSNSPINKEEKKKKIGIV